MADYCQPGSDYNASDPDGEYMYQYQDANITALDRSHDEFWNAAYPDAVDMPDQTTGVDNVLQRAGCDEIESLTIIDHGQPGNQHMGQPTNILRDPAARQEHLDNLNRLYGHFSEDGHVDLGGCDIAEGEEGAQYMRDVTRETGVPTTASLDPQSPTRPGFENRTMTCVPGAQPTDPIDCVVTDPDAGVTLQVPGETIGPPPPPAPVQMPQP